jgi:hypothetical protein
MANECEWFHKCDNEAVALVDHPTLGEVPTCGEHVDWLTVDWSPTKMVPPMAARVMKNRAAAFAAGEK